MAGARPRGNWVRVSNNSPCAVCKSSDWCSVSADGTVRKCMKVADGAFRTKKDKNGAEYYLHRFDGTAPLPPAPPPPSILVSDRADGETLHRVYTALLARLQLSEAHRDSLRQRGMCDDEIDRRCYRTLAVRGRASLARALREQLGDAVLSVPGFIVKQGDGGRSYVTLAGAAGMLVPVRELAGRIVALLTRRDDASDGRGKYLYLSSAGTGGPGSGAPMHVPLGVAGQTEIVRVTEGVLKSDITHALSGVPTIGLPGVASWLPALPMLRELGARTVRLALDMDAADKPTVARPLVALAEALAAEGFAVELERWPVEYKGIDDALAAGATVEVLTGDAARQAVADALTEATAGEPIPESGPLGRLATVLANGGAEELYRDEELLRALARLAEENAPEYMCVRARLRATGVRLTELNKILAPLQQEIRRERPPLDADGCYRVSAGRFVRDVLTNQQGIVEVPLANWSGRIVEETVHDDGAERRITFSVEGALADGTPLPLTDVASDQFGWMRWPVEAWGTRAVVLAGAATADHLRVALQLLSRDVPRRTVYGHTGWREIGGVWVYLHAGGAIGAAGAVEGVTVALPDALARFELPRPPEGAELVEAVRSSLRLLDLGPDRIIVPVLAAVYRAALAEADFALHLSGRTGVFKSELAALGQQHYGHGLDARHLPGSWSSTGNSLEALAFAAKDALIGVDDFAPCGSTADVQRYHREADRLLRAQGNRSGRGRCRADGSLKAGKSPRGLILSTGEDIPKGQSLRARTFVIELETGDISAAKLTESQRDATAGLFAASLAGFVRWLAPRYADVLAGLRQEHADLRERALVNGNGAHARTPGIVADLALGMKYFLEFAVEADIITVKERDELARRGWTALGEAAAAQEDHVQAAEPCGHFLRLLAGVIASGRGHVTAPDGMEPRDPEAWGWRGKEYTHRGEGGVPETEISWMALGRRIGWLDGTDLYLEPEAAYAEAQEMARHQGDSLAVQLRTLWRRMRDRNLLATWDTVRQRNTIRRTLGGKKDRDVLHLHADVLSGCAQPSEPSAGSSDQSGTQKKRTVAADGRADSWTVTATGPSAEPSADSEENGVCGRFGRSETGEEATLAGNCAQPIPVFPNGQTKKGRL